MTKKKKTTLKKTNEASFGFISSLLPGNIVFKDTVFCISKTANQM
jgi:hypothetical protein